MFQLSLKCKELLREIEERDRKDELGQFEKV